MTSTKRNTRKAFVLIGSMAIAAVAAIAGPRWNLYHCDAYKVAIAYLKGSKELMNQAGTLTSESLSWTKSNSVEELEIDGKITGTADFNIDAKGSAAEVSIHLSLVRDEKGWAITDASFSP